MSHHRRTDNDKLPYGKRTNCRQSKPHTCYQVTMKKENVRIHACRTSFFGQTLSQDDAAAAADIDPPPPGSARRCPVECCGTTRRDGDLRIRLHIYIAYHNTRACRFNTPNAKLVFTRIGTTYYYRCIFVHAEDTTGISCSYKIYDTWGVWPSYLYVSYEHHPADERWRRLAILPWIG